MGIVLNHMIIPAADREQAAKFLADLLGLDVGEPAGPFTPVQVNDDLTLDFDDRHGSRAGHYAFLIDDERFDGVLALLAEHPEIDYGSGRELGWDRDINHLGGGRGVYVRDPNGHSYELFTVVPF
ncbi:VOC family protein [Kibdelosporangium phytohabitans]|uniref:Bleomycin resistance protein n=1 Tax=Kibdelosporangium phytohabitans TaxID=860235 RepID=A0A0N9IB11_9PSEU|nr:VOC family protein [Kibdelosporangium phytohabitans]ALG11780.1 bleomycin resistance protein [Kibdelosporangium phytohabitans]MBE1463187.1 catechol 2,3-dioxygenase-like lactoylglutathione lyase family enzyme [Kibdelosporangium phytohabitans]